jgi:pectinesterase
VAQDGSGNVKTVQEAFNAVSDNAGRRTIIFIKNGRYKEKLILTAAKKNVTIIGENVDSVVLTFDDHAGKLLGNDTLDTFTSYSTSIEGDGFIAERITFENSAGRVGQAVAIMIRSDKAFFRNCRFVGNQDTFFTNTTGRVYVKDSYIEGTTDFIFGNAVAVFERCRLHSKKKSHVTAASTPEGNKFGYVFLSCTLTADSGIKGVSLGRPWRPFARVVYLGCEIGAHIAPEGWNNWKNPENEKTAYYAEYRCTGPGAITAGRVPWSRQLNDKEAAVYILKNIFAADAASVPYADDWTPPGE